MSSSARALIEKALDRCGIEINGNREFDVQVHDDRVFERVLTQGTLGLGEAYVEGWWDCEALDVMLDRVLRNNLQKTIGFDLRGALIVLRAKLLNMQRLRGKEVAEKHYDIGNDLYEAMLDKRMIYSCAYWREADNIDDAQEAKLDLICRKVGLQAGEHILDIGSGWGGFMKYAASEYGVSATGVTLSREQQTLAEATKGNLPIQTLLQDYMTLEGKFDHAISIGMFEHVGYKNYRPYMEKVASLLADDGLFLLHTIGSNTTDTHGDFWIDKYIFPNGMLPSARQITAASEGVFVMEDWHNFGTDYDRTLMAWYDNFNRAWPSLKENYGERFYRIWRYYLMSSAAMFRSRSIQLWQIVFSRKGVTGGYRSIR